MKSFFRWHDSVFVYQFYQIFRYVVSVLISIVLVKSALPQEDLGYYEIIIFIVTSLSAALAAGLNNGVFALYGTLPEVNQSRLPQNYVVLLIGLSLILGSVLWLFQETILELLSSLTYLPALELAPLFLFFSVPLVAIEGILFLKNKNKALLVYTLVSQLGLLIGTLIVSILSPHLYSFLCFLIFWASLRWVYLLMVSNIFNDFQLDGKFIFRILKYSLPLIFTMFLGLGMDMIDGIFVAHYFEASYFPIFKYGAREMPLTVLLMSSLSVAMIPSLAQSQLKDNTLKERVSRLMHILYPISYALMLISPWAFTTIYSEAYRDSAYIFNIYLLILMSRILLPQAFTMALQKHTVVMWSSFLELLLNVALSYIFIGLWGVYGLALATVIAYFFQKLYLMIYNRLYHGLSFSSYVDWRYYFFYNSVLILVFIVSFYHKL